METLNTVLLIVVIFLLTKQSFIKVQPKTIRKSNTVILDTCALIDGRIIDLCNSGFTPQKLIVPQFILNELQMLADGSDDKKRERARFGLSVVKELQSNQYSDVIIDRTFSDEKRPTDDKLVDLAIKLNSPLYTTDYNLNKVADIRGVKVLNVNELAQQLRPSLLPGEKITIKIIQKGSNQNQGVGYLDDGTMVVVEGGSRFKGRTITVEVLRTIQTVAGKMLFAQPFDTKKL